MTDRLDDIDDPLEGAYEVLPYGTERPTNYDLPLPAWVEGLRSQQVDAIRESVEHYRNDVPVVFLDAPVGVGKTLIGDIMPREVSAQGLMPPAARRLYICSDKALQRQFDDDFDYAELLMGKANYPTLDGPGDVTCDDCTALGPKDPCMWCKPKYLCPYRTQKKRALEAPIAVLNTSMFLHLANYTRDFRRNDMVIADEADLLESSLLGFTEYEVPFWIGRELNLKYPKKGVHKPTLIKWLQQAAEDGDVYLDARGDKLEPKQFRRMQSWVQETGMVAVQLQLDVDNSRKHEDDDSDGDDAGHWIREYATKTLKLLPVKVDAFGAKELWRHGKLWLCMSGTILSADEMADSLGLPLDYEVVSVDSPFPVENRPVIVAPIAKMSGKEVGPAEFDRMAYAIAAAAEDPDHGHQWERGLVHTHSYKNTRELMTRVEEMIGYKRELITYESAFQKQAALERFLRTPCAIMFAPSMDRGVDLKDDRCRWQVISKVPNPFLGDRQVSARTRLPNGWTWYAMQAIRAIVQMSGRIVRTPEDKGTTYILDSDFNRLYKQHGAVFPKYFVNALRTRDDIRWLMQ